MLNVMVPKYCHYNDELINAFQHYRIQSVVMIPFSEILNW